MKSVQLLKHLPIVSFSCWKLVDESLNELGECGGGGMLLNPWLGGGGMLVMESGSTLGTWTHGPKLEVFALELGVGITFGGGIR